MRPAIKQNIMSKYIDAEKLIERLEEMKRAEYENCGGVNSKTGALQEVQELIASLQQEQPGVDFETEYAKFSNDTDALDYAFPIDLADYKDFARHFYELGLKAKRDVDLGNYISNKLRELGADLINHKPYSFNRGLNVGKGNAYRDILDRLNARKEE